MFNIFVKKLLILILSQFNLIARKMCLNFFFAIFIINKIKIVENKTTKKMELSLSKLRSVLTTLFIFFLLKTKNEHNLRIYRQYINKCQKSIMLYKEEEKINRIPFFSICIPVYNMQNYIEISLSSVLNQSFRDFEIVIINDFSLDNSEKIISKMKINNTKIRVINHKENLGVYISRVDAIKNAKGKYIIFLDPDDLFSNQNLLRYLYDYNSIYNEDIIEFTVIIKEETENKLYYPLENRRNHFHNFEEKIIHHPELSNILYYENNYYSDIICRCIWNKMIRKDVLDKSINFLGHEAYKKKHFDFAEDTIINLLNFEFASNYSNLHLIGYMYNIRKDSMSHSNKKKDVHLKMAYNILFFYVLFYKYIKHFNKDLNYLLFDLKAFDNYLNYINYYNSSSSEKKPIIDFYKKLLKETNISYEFKNYAKISLFKYRKKYS